MRKSGEGAVAAIGMPQVGIWLCPIGDEVPGHVDECCQAVLGVQERNRFSAFRFSTHRREYLHSHYFLRRVLSAELGANPSGLSFSIDELGKPWLEGQDVNFNLSHTGGVAACCVSTGDICGIDVERHRALPDLDLVAERNFSIDERALLAGTDPAEKHALFYRIWTLKEAYIKACGVGLSAELTAFSVLPRPDGRGELRVVGNTPMPSGPWSIYWWNFLDEFDMAVAFAGRVERPGITMIRLEDLVTSGGYHEQVH